MSEYKCLDVHQYIYFLEFLDIMKYAFWVQSEFLENSIQSVAYVVFFLTIWRM
jgi:hypothetical protein